MTKFKKTIIFLLVFLIVFSFFGFKETEKTKVYAVVVTCVNCSTWAGDIAQFAQTIAKWLKDDLMKALRDVIAKRIIDYIVDQTVEWIQGGGKPQFVGDWDKFVENAGKIAQDSLIKEIGLSPLCSPFKLQVQLALLPEKRFRQRIECTLDDIVKNIEDFYADFSKGGWLAYRESWSPNNNFFGSALIAYDEMAVNIAKKETAAKNEAIAGQGWISVKKNYGGTSIDNLSDEDFNALNLDEDQYDLLKQYEEGGKTLDSLTDEEFNALNLDEDQYQKLSDMKFGEPPNEKIITPGQAVGEMVGSSLTSDQEWASNIESWVSALVNALINRITKEGLSMLKGSDSSKTAYRPPEYKDMIAQELEKDKQQMYKEISRFTNEWQYLLSAKNKSLSYTQQTRGILEQLQQIQSKQTSLPSACEPLITNEEIQAVQNEIGRLTNETKDLQAKINEANTVIEQIKKADFFNTRQRSLAQISYQRFIDKYGTTDQIESIVSGSARQTADAETQNKQTELTTTQNRFNVCQTAIQSQ